MIKRIKSYLYQIIKDSIKIKILSFEKRVISIKPAEFQIIISTFKLNKLMKQIYHY